MTERDAGWPASLLLTAAALGLVLRVAFAFGYWHDQPLTRDEQEYLSLARGLASGRGFAPDEHGPRDPFGRAPGYPAFLAMVGGARQIATGVPAGVKIAQSVVGACGVLLVGTIAGRLGGRRAAVAASFIAAVYPPLVWTSSYALSEAIAWPLGLLAVWVFDRAMQSGHARVALVAGLVAGIAVLVRPAFVLFVAAAVLWLGWKRRPGLAVLVGLGAAIVIAPWTARNYVHYGRFVLVASEGGVTFWTGNHPDAIGEGDLAANPNLKLASQALRRQYPQLSEEQMEPVYYREAFAWIRSHPADWLLLEAHKLFYVVVPIGPSYRVHSTRYVVASVVSYALVLPAAFVGLVLLGDRRRLAPGLWLLAGSAILVSLMFFPQDRFRVPVIDPALIISAGAVWAAPRRSDIA